jgi:hypothetical protein
MEKEEKTLSPDIRSSWRVHGRKAYRIGKGVAFLIEKGWKLARNPDSKGREYTSLYPPGDNPNTLYKVEVPTEQWVEKVFCSLHNAGRREQFKVENFSIGYESFMPGDEIYNEDQIKACFCIAGYDELWRVLYVWKVNKKEPFRIETCRGKIVVPYDFYADLCLESADL